MSDFNLHQLLAFHINSLEDVDSFILEIYSRFKDYDEVIPNVKSLKEEGNSNFKLGNFKGAIEVYTKVVQLLGAIVLMGVASDSEICDLTVWLNLNISACFLKLGLFQEVIDLCSLILSFDKSNVKALFRRAKANINIGNLEFGLKDLAEAKKLNPSNTDIAHFFDSVHGTMDKEHKLTSSNKEEVIFGKKGEEERISECKRISSVKQNGLDVHVKLEEETKSSEPKDQNLNPYKDRPYTYRNRSNHSKTLSIPSSNMERLKKGSHIQFYEQHSFSVLSIRLLPYKSDRASAIPSGREKESKVATRKTHILTDTHIDHSMVAEVSTKYPSFPIPEGDPNPIPAFKQTPTPELRFDYCVAKMRAARDARKRALRIARRDKFPSQQVRKGKRLNQEHHPHSPQNSSAIRKRRQNFCSWFASAPKKHCPELSNVKLSVEELSNGVCSSYVFSTFTAFPKLAHCDVVQASVMF